jgi:hypothetical protein
MREGLPALWSEWMDIAENFQSQTFVNKHASSAQCERDSRPCNRSAMPTLTSPPACEGAEGVIVAATSLTKTSGIGRLRIGPSRY